MQRRMKWAYEVDLGAEPTSGSVFDRLSAVPVNRHFEYKNRENNEKQLTGRKIENDEGSLNNKERTWRKVGTKKAG